MQNAKPSRVNQLQVHDQNFHEMVESGRSTRKMLKKRKGENGIDANKRVGTGSSRYESLVGSPSNTPPL